MWKKVALFVTLLMASIVFMPTASALAAPELKVSVSAGLDGKAKYGRGAPVTLTIDNKGTAFSGDMVIDMEYTYSMGTGEAYPLEIGAGETKTVTFIVQRMNDNSGMYGMANSKKIFFYEGGWKKGKVIEHKGSQNITTTLHSDDNKFSVQFTDNVDRLAALKTVRYSNMSQMVLIDANKIAASKFPDEAVGWGAANVIIVDEYPIADLTSEQQQALIGWVRAGGIMVFGSSDNSLAEAGLFADYLPLKLQGNTEMNTAILNKWAATEDFTGMIAAYTTELTADAHPLLEEGNNVWAAYKQLGEGLIMQTAFSVGDEPLAKMDGMTAFWNTLLEKGERMIYGNSMSQNYYYNDPMESIVYTIGSANELFPSFKVSAPLILGIIIFYMIIIIPVLYFILKRKDKREYTWWIIPAIAVVVSVAIFGYGAKDRIARAQVQHTAVLDVALDGSLSGYFAESLLTNKSGDFQMTAPSDTTLYSSLRRDNLFGSSSFPNHKSTMLEKDLTGSTVHLRDAGYWDVATVYGQSTVEKVGTYKSQLRIDDKQLTGTITNDFPFALTEVSIWSGSTLIPIGDLGPGETVQVDETLKTNTLLPRRSIYNPYMNPAASNGEDLTKMRKDSLLTFSDEQMNKTAKPVLIGYTDTQIVPIELVQGKPGISSMTMITQPVEVDVTFNNTFTVVPEMMNMSLVSEDALYEADKIGNTVDEYFFHEPVYLQTWQLPEELKGMKLKWASFEVSKIQKQLFDVSILNIKTGEYEQQDASKFTLTDNLDSYLSPEGTVVLRLLVKNAQNGQQGRVPQLKLNGEVAK
ncbi:hypothetical protein [Sporosarcina sp. NPDC096371]|uniref:hypothetical protein n=1 Tax=Sporosarcina sp. NPDC096371 TaxID=3364530 RepID=UPI0037F3EB61